MGVFVVEIIRQLFIEKIITIRGRSFICLQDQIRYGRVLDNEPRLGC